MVDHASAYAHVRAVLGLTTAPKATVQVLSGSDRFLYGEAPPSAARGVGWLIPSGAAGTWGEGQAAGAGGVGRRPR